MSSKPDGTDPRILQPEGETVLIASTTRQSKGRKYHKENCKSLRKIKGGAKEVDISVVKWKNYQKCCHCYDVGNTEHKPKLTGKEVDQIRRALVEGYNTREVASGYGYCKSTIRYHAKATRAYNYQQEPQTPPVEYTNTWVWADE